ncbi:META domain-containing protein [Streptomyces sp. BE147]|uniref:META domain-containing protein n=2 Tax=unclassified Streptomyces TaxID=2593676 RepID=UPI002E75FB95|nr:META domain-containing protein [Streptomyces sp. BE147]MEE1740224.1 META domain-containing protein [Streptomyces sp. BE147]
MRTQRMAVSVLALFALVACGTQAAPGSGSGSDGSGSGDGSGTVRTDPPVTGTKWTVTTLVSGRNTTALPADLPDGRAPHLTFGEDGTVEGSLGCNTFHGKATVKGTTITFGPLASTRKMCAAEAMEVERSVLAVLAGETTYTIKDQVLSLTAPGGKGLGASAVAPEPGKSQG